MGSVMYVLGVDLKKAVGTHAQRMYDGYIEKFIYRLNFVEFSPCNEISNMILRVYLWH